jgi:hypothetical protein
MEEPICLACGTQFSGEKVQACPICEDERQFVPSSGQGWTTLPKMQKTHMGAFRHDGEFLGIGTSPAFAIGQRALLVRTQAGNVLWDCVSLISPAMVELIRGLGGLACIAISHPHYYTSMLEWSRAFGGVPVHLHAADRRWVMRTGPEIIFWSGLAKQILPGVTLVHCPGHFDGGQIMHCADAASGQGTLLTGDLLQVVADRKHVSFMRSYPNFIPLSATSVRAIAEAVDAWTFESIYGAFWDRVIPTSGKAAFAASVKRYLDWVQ